MTVTGTSGNIKETFTFTLAVSSGVGDNGAGTPLDLSSDFDVYGIYEDGSQYSTGGLDGLGYSYSANLLTGSRVMNGVLFDFGPANQEDVVSCTGQTIALPPRQYSDLAILATGVNGSQFFELLTVHYTDGSTAQVQQNFSDWYTPQNFNREHEGVAMPYRNFDNGTKDERMFNLYAYRFRLNPNKVVQSVTLQSDPDVVILAATLLPAAGAK